MGNILIRNLDDEVIAAWKEQAEDNGRSLQAELHAELSKAMQARRRAKAIEALRQLRESSDISKLGCESWELIWEAPDTRYAG